MVATPTEQPTQAPAGSEAEAVAIAILGATERAVDRIMQATENAAKVIAEAVSALPTALSTPPAQINQASPEDIAAIIERYQPDYGGPNLTYDPSVDAYMDEFGNRVAPDWQPPGGEEGVVVPDPTRDLSDVIAPGSVLVPGIPRLDLFNG